MNWDKLKIPNLILESIESGKIKVVSDQEAAECEWRVCSDAPGMLSRSVADKCSQCGKNIAYDPAQPRSDNQKLICISCVMDMAKGRQSFPV